jgi:hypothetical protein
MRVFHPVLSVLPFHSLRLLVLEMFFYLLILKPFETLFYFI